MTAEIKSDAGAAAAMYAKEYHQACERIAALEHELTAEREKVARLEKIKAIQFEFLSSRQCADHNGKWERGRCLQCEIERLEKDAARLDYLDANTRLILRSGKQRIRPLIDAAMKGEVDD